MIPLPMVSRELAVEAPVRPDAALVAAGGAGTPSAPTHDEAVRKLVVDYYDFVWRSLRRLGLAPSEVDDALQQVFLVASRRLASIHPGSERAFLFGTLVKVASIARRTASRRRETLDADELAGASDGGPTPDDALDYRRARELLDVILDQMDMDLRTVFVLYELEELTVPEIARLVGVPVGTVASRLRRARQAFEDALKRYRARREFRGGAR